MSAFFLGCLVLVVFFYGGAIYHRATKAHQLMALISMQLNGLECRIKELEASHQILKDAIGVVRSSVKNLHN
jgi:hypothetical protein